MSVHIDIIGGGPVGMACANLLEALDDRIKVTVYDKRPTTTRDNPLYLAGDSIDKVTQLLAKRINNPHARRDKASLLQEQFEKWRKTSVRTSKIETTLTEFATKNFSMNVHRGEANTVTAENFQSFRVQHPCPILIGADGDKSQVRTAIGSKRIDEMTLGYLMQFRFATTADVIPRNKIELSSEASKSGGWDYETVPRTEAGILKTVTLQRFVDHETYQSLQEQRIEKDQPVLKGSSQHAWSVKEFKDMAEAKKGKAKEISDHIQKFLADHGLKESEYNKDAVSAFPILVSHTDTVAKVHDGAIVLLGGDASSVLSLRRGVNKGFKEAALLVESILDYVDRTGAKSPATILPEEFVNYQTRARALYENEKWWVQLWDSGIKAKDSLFHYISRIYKWGCTRFCSLFSARRS